MKKTILYTIILFTFFISCKKDNSTSVPITGIGNDIYYSLVNGVVGSVSSTNWDIAFNTYKFSPTIITNGGAGIKLYTYPNGDTSVWNNTLSISSLNTWPVMYNADTCWTWGAFQRNKTSNPLDYGWGVYNMITNELVGDSLFIIQLQDKSYRKLWMIKRAINNTFIFKYANLDGSGIKTDSVNCNNYSSKNFIYYSIAQEKTIDREPAAGDWDFVTTKYIATSGEQTPTVVTGILTSWIFNVNPATYPATITPTGTLSEKVSGVDTTTNVFSTANFSTNISTIGWSWGIYNQTANNYSIIPQQVYFLKTSSASVYKIVFTGFTASTGLIQFNQTKLK
jgi:hypothetical protein